MAFLHVLFAPRAEGCPRLALDLIRQENAQRGEQSSVAFLVEEPRDLLKDFQECCRSIHHLGWQRRGFGRLFLQMRNVLRDAKPDGIICYTLGHHVPIALAAKSFGIPLVLHIGNAPPSNSSDRRKIKILLKLGSPFVRMHLACSDTIARDCRNVYRLDNVKTAANGIDLSRFFSSRDQKESRKPPNRSGRVLGMIASLSPHKDHALLIEAMSILKRRGATDRLVLAGEGSELAQLRKLAEDLEVMDRIDWLGNVSDVANLLTGLDLFVFATTPSEGLGIALVEAMAAGVPLIASDVPACREVLEGGRWGTLVSERTGEAWANAIASHGGIPIAPTDALARYDIRETWSIYRKAILQ